MARASWRDVFSRSHQKARELRDGGRPTQEFPRDNGGPLRGWELDCYLGQINGAKDEHRGNGSFTEVYGRQILVLGEDGVLHEYIKVETNESGHITTQLNSYRVNPSFRIQFMRDTTNKVLEGLNKL
jgi:hypothetical protein